MLGTRPCRRRGHRILTKKSHVKKNDVNSYRLTYVVSETETNYDLSCERKLGFSSFSPVFIEHRLLHKLDDKSVAAFLNHTQEMLTTEELFPVQGSVLDSKEKISDEHAATLAEIFSEIFVSANRSHHSIRRDLSFILQFHIEHTRRLVPLGELWSLWKKHGKKAYSARNEDLSKKGLNEVFDLVDYVLREAFFFGHDSRVNGSAVVRRTELNTCHHIRRSLNPHGVPYHIPGIKARDLLVATSMVARTADRELGKFPETTDHGSKMRVMICDLIEDPEYYANNTFKTLLSFYRSPKKVLSNLDKMTVEEILVMSSIDSFPQLPQRRKKVMDVLRASMEPLLRDGLRTASASGMSAYVNGYPDPVLSPYFIEKVTGIELPFDKTARCPEGYNLLSRGNAGDVNYIICLLVENLEADEVIDLISYFNGKGNVDPVTLPTVSQWERFIRDRHGRLGDMPPEIAIEMSSRKRNVA